MDAELLRTVTTLSAVILGFVLGQVAELFRTRRTSRKASAATRAIVELEIAQNRTMLSDYWHKVIASSYSPGALAELWGTHEAFDRLSVLRRQMEVLEQDSESAGRHAESRNDMPLGILSTLVGSAHFANSAELFAREFETQMRAALKQSFVNFP